MIRLEKKKIGVIQHKRDRWFNLNQTQNKKTLEKSRHFCQEEDDSGKTVSAFTFQLLT